MVDSNNKQRLKNIFFLKYQIRSFFYVDFNYFWYKKLNFFFKLGRTYFVERCILFQQNKACLGSRTVIQLWIDRIRRQVLKDLIGSFQLVSCPCYKNQLAAKMQLMSKFSIWLLNKLKLVAMQVASTVSNKMAS